MSLSDCTPCCSTPVSTAVPGPQGNSAVTQVAAGNSFNIPAINTTVTITVGNTAFFLVGTNVYIGDGSKFGNFIITGLPSTTTMTVKFLGIPGDSAAGSAIAAGALVIAGLGNYTVPVDLDLFTAFTDNSGGTKSDTIPVTVARNIVTFGPWQATTIANGNLYEVALPYNFTVVSCLFRAEVAITTGAKAATFTTRINGGATTGGVISAAGTYAVGATQAGTVISGANTGTAGQTLESLVSGVTAFTEGTVHLEMVVVNTDMTAFIAAVADKLATLRTRLRHQ